MFSICITGIFKYDWGRLDHDPWEKHLRECEDLKMAIRTFYDDYILADKTPADQEFLTRRIKSITGIDFHNDKQLKKLSCKLVGMYRCIEKANTVVLLK